MASAGEDGTVRLWQQHSDRPVAIIAPSTQAGLCSVAFCPASSNLLAFASADHNAYVYDLRAQEEPLFVLAGHQDPVSYVKFLASGEDLITASVDGSLAHWQLSSQIGSQDRPHSSSCTPQQPMQPSQPVPGSSSQHLQSIRSFVGHRNRRNFVGLAVEPTTDLIACGSEDSEVYLYHTAWADPMGHQPLYSDRPSQQHPMTSRASHRLSKQQALPAERSFASAVAWQPNSRLRDADDQLLAAALSDSGVQLFRPHFQCIAEQ